MNLSWLVDLCGVAGFVLSTTLAFIEWRRRHARLIISSPVICPLSSNPRRGNVLFQFSITNRSSVPIGITGATVTLHDTNANLSAARDERVLLKCSLGAASADLRSTPLPFNLSPGESQDISLCLSYHAPALPESLLRLAADNPPKQELSAHRPSVRLRLRLCTSRGPAVFELSAKSIRVSLLLNRLNARTQMLS